MPITKVADIPEDLRLIYSRETLRDALPQMHFRQLVQTRQEAKEAGDTIKFRRLNNVNRGGQLVDEDTPIQQNKMTSSEIQVPLDEFGNAISFTRKASKSSVISLLDEAKLLLAEDYSLVIDSFLRDTFLNTLNKYYMAANGDDGGANNAVAGGFSDDGLDGIVEMAKMLSFPKFNRGGDQFWVFVGTARQIRQIRNSEKWLDARRYVNPSDMLTGEAGRLEGVIFVDSTQMNEVEIPTASLNSKDIHRGLLVGARSVGFGESIPLELIPGPLEDYGRKQSIAWYSIAGAGILNDYIIDVRTEE